MNFDLVTMIITIFCSFIASSGFWLYMQKRSERHDNRTRLLMGLAHDRIVCLGLQYINRGYIARDEYENLFDYLYKPYLSMGGNGTTERIMAGVRELPIKEQNIFKTGE